MSDDLEPLDPVPTDPPLQTDSDPAPVVRSRGNGIAWLIALIALALAGFALWRVYLIERGQSAAQTAVRAEVDARLDTLQRTADQRKRDLDSLRARDADVDAVNRSVREELLGLGERSRHLEDAIANLADQRLSGRDSLALNEAEFLLQQAQERLALFGDAQAAISAYRLADSALATTENPAFASVRQTIGAELQALQASKPLQTRAALTTLESIRVSVASMPAPQVAADASSAASGWRRFLAEFVQVHHGNQGAQKFAASEPGLNRALVAIDLRAAQAALLARDAQGFKSALADSRRDIESSFDPRAEEVRKAVAELDQLAMMPFAPALPELGSALTELRNLRATRALAQPQTAPVAVPETLHDTPPVQGGDGA